MSNTDAAAGIDPRRAYYWAAPVCHPLPLGAALALAINDHWLKGAEFLPSALTGKLSDIFGLFFFPALLLAVWRLATSRARQADTAREAGGLPWSAGRARETGTARETRWPALLALSLTAAGFAAANLSPTFNGWLATWWGSKVMDPSDLAALPVLWLSWLWLGRCDDA